MSDMIKLRLFLVINIPKRELTNYYSITFVANMKPFFSPHLYHQMALTLHEYRWRLLLWSGFAFTLYILLEGQIVFTTPNSLVWLALFILFSALQSLVFAAFIFFFYNLPSLKAETSYWFKVYRTIEWCEAILFTLLLPLPTIVFIYALFTVNN
jgi:hypothetical protein